MNYFTKILLLFLPISHCLDPGDLCQENCEIETRLELQPGDQNVVFKGALRQTRDS